MISCLGARHAATACPPAKQELRWFPHSRSAILTGLCIATFLAVSPACAQYGWRDRDYYYGDRDYPDYPDYPGMSLADIRQKVADRGMHLIATPRRKGRIFLAEAEDAHGIRHRLVFDAFVGRLIENTVLGPKTPINRESQTPPTQHPPADAANKTITDPGKDKGQTKADKPPTTEQAIEPDSQTK
jgi:hypothetical protein